jgi:hypothetical protein
LADQVSVAGNAYARRGKHKGSHLAFGKVGAAVMHEVDELCERAGGRNAALAAFRTGNGGKLSVERLDVGKQIHVLY